MGAFPKFDPVAFLQKPRVHPAKVAKVAKLSASGPSASGTLATLATLAASTPAFRIGGDHDRLKSDPERVAIILADGIPEDWAMAYATLQAMTCPAWIVPEQWRRLVDAGGRCVEKWAPAMARLGWDSREVLAVGPDAQGLDFEAGGLLWALEHGAVVLVTAEGVTVRYQDGGTRLIRRKAGQPPIWQFD